MYFRKKPVVIEAVQFDGTEKSVDEFLNRGFVPPLTNPDVVFKDSGGECLISTLEGVMTAKSGDWIIRGVKGELYPCKSDIFVATYEHVVQHTNELAQTVNRPLGIINVSHTVPQTLDIPLTPDEFQAAVQILNGPLTPEESHKVSLYALVVDYVGPMPQKPAGMVGGDIIIVPDDAAGTVTYIIDPQPAQLADDEQKAYATAASMWVAKMNAAMAFFKPA